MHHDLFQTLVAEEFPHAVPEQFQAHLQNVAFIIEDEPSLDVRTTEHLSPNETLLGYYHGIPTTVRGNFYGMGMTLPDTITLYQVPIEKEAAYRCKGDITILEDMTRRVIRDTIWHEVAHHFGMDEGTVRKREEKRGQKQ